MAEAVETIKKSGADPVTRVAAYYDRHVDALYGLGFAYCHDPELAQECVQEAFCSLLAALRRNEVIDEPLRYLVSVVRNQATNRHRQSRREIAAAEEPTQRGAGALEALAQVEADRQLWATVAQLPPEQQEVVYMHISNGCTFEAIHHALDVPLGTLLKRYYSALRSLQTQWKDKQA